MSRTRRFVGGLGFGYAYFALVMLVGLWLTPFLLGRIGQQDYGLWLVASQLLAYMALLDLGVVGLLPRETAYATGGAADQGDRAARIGRALAIARTIVRWQLPLVALAALATWMVVWYESPRLAIPFAFILIAFVLLFPLRLSQATLQGLQQLPFLGQAQMVGWAAGTIAIVALVLAGAGLYALAAGWILTQVIVLVASRLRVRRHLADLPPAPRAPIEEVRSFAGRAGWISVGQIAHVLLFGTDLLIVGKLLGAAAVVPYACTAKLVTVLANHPQMLMQTAMPALSEMRAGREHERMFDASTALTVTILVASGAVATVVLAINGGFVTWWVGPSQYLGFPVTLALVVTLLVRHWNLTATSVLFCLGHERRVSLANLAEGVATVAAVAVLVPQLGLLGVPLGALAATVAVSLPWNLRKVAASMDVPLRVLVAPLWPWFWRWTLLAGGSAFAGQYLRPSGVLEIGGLGAAVAVVYVAVMAHGLWRSALGRFVRPRLVALWPRAERFVPAV